MADLRIPRLLKIPARVRFLSCEPLLGPVDVRWALSAAAPQIAAGFLRRGHFSPGLETLRPLDWIISGGESGPRARPSSPVWHRSLRDQCIQGDVPYLFKQWGEWCQGHNDKLPMKAMGEGILMTRFGKKAAGRRLDGRTWDEFPAPP